MSGQPPRGKLAQVALKAGVSVATASRVLSGTGRVSEAKARRVRDAAAELRYRPNRHARSLRATDREPLVGIILDPDSIFGVERDTHKFWFLTLFTVLEELARSHISAVQISSRSPELIERLNFDAVCVMSLIEWPDNLIELYPDVPILSLTPDTSGEHTHVTYIGYDYEAMCLDALRLLTEKGCSRIALVVRGGGLLTVSYAIDAYEQWCEERGVTPVVVGEGESNAAVSDRVAELCRDGIDGFYAWRGESRSVLEGIKRAGLSCPQDVLFIAGGEGTAEELLHPTVSIVRADAVEAGNRLAAELKHLVDVSHGGEQARAIMLGHEVVERESTTR